MGKIDDAKQHHRFEKQAEFCEEAPLTPHYYFCP